MVLLVVVLPMVLLVAVLLINGSFGCGSSFGSFGCGFSYKWFLRRAELVCEDLLDGGSQLKGGVEQDQGGQHLKKQSVFSIIIQNIQHLKSHWSSELSSKIIN